MCALQLQLRRSQLRFLMKSCAASLLHCAVCVLMCDVIWLMCLSFHGNDIMLSFSVVMLQFQFQLGWAVCATQRLRPQYGSISHPQKIPSKYWVLRVRGRNSKKHNYPAHVYWSVVADQIMSLRSSDYSSPKRKGYCLVQRRIHGIHGPP